MGESEKRWRQHRDYENDEPSEKRRTLDKVNSEGELVGYRILCPDRIVGSVIGKGGKNINAIRQETHARVKVVMPIPGADKRIINIYCFVRNKESISVNEDAGEPYCPAQRALLKVHDAIVNALVNYIDEHEPDGEEANILVPASQSSSIIGKSGVTIKRLRSSTGAKIKVIPKDPQDSTHSCAQSFDNFLQITGEKESVRKALYAVSAIMFKISPKEMIDFDSISMELPQNVIIPSDVPIFPSLYSAMDSIPHPMHSGLPVMSANPHAVDRPRFGDASSSLSVYTSAFPILPGHSAPAHSAEFSLRILCPPDKIGHVIGRGGGIVKGIRQASGARIEIDDKKNGLEDCVITVISTESTNDVKSAAVEAVLLLQPKINDENEENGNIRLLVPSKVVGQLIGKGGSIINDIRKKTRADIYISKGKKPMRASATDELVELSGDMTSLRDALVQIILKLREDILKEEDGQVPFKDSAQTIPPVDPSYDSTLSFPSLLPVMPPLNHLHYERSEMERTYGVTPSSYYGYNPLQAVDSIYGSVSSYTSKPYEGLLSYIEMAIPASAVSKVMGKGGSNLENIKKISGAHIEIVESKLSRFEQIAQISGTREQKQSAENLIKAFILST